MSRFKLLVKEAALLLIFVIVGSLIFSLISFDGQARFSVFSRLLWVETIASICLLVLCFMIYYRLRYRVAWMLIMFILAITGFGVRLPEFFLLFPFELLPIFPTFFSISIFWVFEKLESKFIGVEVSNFIQSEFLLDENEIISLDLDENNNDRSETTMTKPDRS